MRILQIDKFLDRDLPAAGGVGRQVAILTDHLRRAGHEVLHFGCAAEGPAGPMPAFIDYTALEGGAAVKLRGALRILHDFSAARKLAAFLADNRVDVAHAHNLYHHLTPSVLGVLRQRRIPVVMTVHDYRLMCPVKHFYRRGETCTKCLPHRYWRCVVDNCAGGRLASAAVALETFCQRFFRRYIRNVERVLCPSRFIERALRRDGWPANKLTVAANAIEPFDPPAKSADAGEGVLYAGRLSEEKGPELMLDVAEALPNTPVRILGDGEMFQSLCSQAQQRGLSNVELPGHVPAKELGRYFAEADVVVIPSRCFEVSPQAALEGMLAGRCVVAPAHGPVTEWITDGRTGRLFAPGDAADLCRVVSEALADGPARAAMGAAAAEIVRDKHDPAGVVARLIEIYEEAVRRCESP